MVARALGISHTCIYDACAAYDHNAVGTALGGSLRRPASERTLSARVRAISFAAYRAAVDLFPRSTTTVFDPLMRDLGYDGADVSTDIATPTGIGNVAAQAVLDFRHARVLAASRLTPPTGCDTLSSNQLVAVSRSLSWVFPIGSSGLWRSRIRRPGCGRR
jgi:hypothetical protein